MRLEKITQQQEQAENLDRFIGKVQRYLNLQKFTPTVLNDMRKAVYVPVPDKSSGYRVQDIDVPCGFTGIRPYSLLNRLQNGETA